MASCGEEMLEPVAKKSKQQDSEEPNNDENKNSDSRPMCKYGERCFRSSSQHKAEFQHPKTCAPSGHELSHERSHENEDCQYEENLSACPYGVDCEETELIHFAEYDHPLKEISEENGNQKEENECDVVDASEAWSASYDHEAATQQLMDDDDDYIVDDDRNGCDNTDGSFPSSISRDNTVLSRGPSIVKCYSILTEEERKELIRRAFELKDMLKKELDETQKIIEKKNKELKRVHSQLEKVSKIEGEQEAIESDKLVYFPLFAEREYKEGSAAQIHFRLAESQFYRLVNVKDNYRITKVEYIVNPSIMKRFKKAQQTLKKMRGEEQSYPVLAFHGTKEENISSISETGFRTPGDDNFEHATDTGFYGRGVYFSEYPSYSMVYIKGATKLLLCQVLPGKAYRCTKLIHGEPLQSDHDSHTSPDGKELVIFNSHHILPSYIVHYGEADGDYSYEEKE